MLAHSLPLWCQSKHERDALIIVAPTIYDVGVWKSFPLLLDLPVPILVRSHA